MKELTIEQKAQRYDEAIEKAKGVIEQNPPMKYLKKGIEYIFPELKESEDERIKKKLIDLIYKVYVNTRYITCVEHEDMLAWLEKQSEQKPVISNDAIREGIAHFGITQYQIDNWLKKYVDVENQCEQKPQGKPALEAVKEEKVDNQNCVKSADKVEPKFHEGEWLCENEPNNYARFIQILEIVNVQGKERYRISRDLHNDEDIVECQFVEDNWHPFNIKDAKDGDVLSDETTIFIFKDLLSDGSVMSYCDYDTDSGESDAFCPLSVNLMCSKITPATKEQRDLLFQKMKEAGYEWDAEKKELKKIESDLTEFENALADICRGWIGEELGWKDYIIKNSFPLLELAKKQFDKYEQKPDGWSENKKLYTIDVYYPTCGSEVKEAIEQGIAYSKTEKKEILISLNGIFLRITPSSTTENVINEYNNYAGKNTVIKEKTNFINQWNNDDELYLKGVITDIECEVLCANCSREIADLKIHWLKSLKDRYTWKPSDEQMYILNWVTNLLNDGMVEKHAKGILESLYNELKKLK